MAHDLKIFTDNVEPEAVNQIYNLIVQPPFAGSRVRIMPDVHYGTGCVVGFTASVGDKIIPNVLGVDLGCGMLCAELGKVEIDLEALDAFIREKIPSGARVRKEVLAEDLIDSLKCRKELNALPRLYGSLGTLGGGNHFIEIDGDEEGNKYLVIHSGSRNVGLQVAKIYQRLAVEKCKNAAEEERLALIASMKGRPAELAEAIEAVNKKYAHRTKIAPEFCYLDGADREDYLHDLKICTEFASRSRKKMCEEIVKFLKIYKYSVYETVHNYLGEDGILRKGAIAAHAGQKILIPMNMRDGCLVAIGKGNEDWNWSCPHGAGRLFRRSETKELFTVEEYREEMGIYSTSIGEGTLDESPMVYKPMQEIMTLIEPAAEVVGIIKPLYNFKAGGE